MPILHRIPTSGTPEIKLVIRSDFGEIEAKALIDTGFSGFVLVPPVDAQDLQLEEEHRDPDVVLADGRNITVIYSPGEVILRDKKHSGEIGWIENSKNTDVIIGCELLKQAKLIIDYGRMEIRVP